MPTRDASIQEQGAHERSRLVARAGVVGAGTLASRVLGLVRDMALAALFDRDATDAWWVAFTIPNALRQLLAEGAVSSAVVPVLAEKLAKDGDDAARAFFARVRGVSLVALVVVTVLGVAFAGPLTELFADGYRARPGRVRAHHDADARRVPVHLLHGHRRARHGRAQREAALRASRRSRPACSTWRSSRRRCSCPGRSWRAATIRVLALALGALVGGVLQVVAQWPALRAIGYAGAPRLELDDRRARASSGASPR